MARQVSEPVAVRVSCPPARRFQASLAVACVLGLAVTARDVRGQFGGMGGMGGFGFGGPVGGISIDADGVVRAVDEKVLDQSVRALRAVVATTKLPARAEESRTISLAGIVAAVKDAADGRGPVPVDVGLLGGLERITHVFAVPAEHDILLTGPADVPAVDAAGTVVGKHSGRPLLRLEDLVVALRAFDQSRAGGIVCSIDPTPHGIARLQDFLARQKTMSRDPAEVFRGMEQALGQQTVTVGGVPGDSRFALVLVSADSMLKRIGMGYQPSGIKELPSYLTLVKPGGRASSLPRFWLEAEYEPLARDADELTWQIRGRRMKCLSASDQAAADGIRRGIGPRDPSLDAWCQAMTEHYDRLAVKHPVFAELLNCVDLAVVATVIRGRQLDVRAGLDLGPLMDDARLALPKYEVAKSVPTVANGLKKGTNWVLSASGGVLLQPWQFAGNSRQVDGLDAPRSAATAGRPAGPPAAACWWD